MPAWPGNSGPAISAIRGAASPDWPEQVVFYTPRLAAEQPSNPGHEGNHRAADREREND